MDSSRTLECPQFVIGHAVSVPHASNGFLSAFGNTFVGHFMASICCQTPPRQKMV